MTNDQQLTIRPIGYADLMAVYEIEVQMFPAYHIWGIMKERELLSVPLIKGMNFSLGLFEGDQMVGYIIGFRAPSHFYPAQQVVWAEEFTVLPAFRAQGTLQLLNTFFREAARCGFSVEGDGRDLTGYKMIQRGVRWWKRLGFALQRSEAHQHASGEAMHWFRLELQTPPLTDHRVWWRFWFRVYCARIERSSVALPRRILRHLCLMIPEEWCPPILRKASYLVYEY